jgi:hypothetical protein
MPQKTTIVFCFMGLLAVSSTQASHMPSLAEGLLSQDAQARQRAERAILESREQTIVALEVLIEENLRDYHGEKVFQRREQREPVDSKYLTAKAAMRLLGDLRSVRSVPLLVRHMNYWPDMPESGGVPHLSDYVAAEALAAIGVPSLEPVMQHYTGHGSNGLITSWILEHVLGREMARVYVRRALAARSPPATKESLWGLLHLLSVAGPATGDSHEPHPVWALPKAFNPTFSCDEQRLPTVPCALYAWKGARRWDVRTDKGLQQTKDHHEAVMSPIRLAASMMQEPPGPSLVEGLRSEDAETRQEAHRAILKSREQTIAALETLIEESLKDYGKEAKHAIEESRWQGKPRIPAKYLAAKVAMRLLGKLRSVRSVPLLIRHMGYWPDMPVAGSAPGLENYVAAESLAEIGVPSLGPVLEEYLNQGNTEHFIFVRVLGRDMARAYVQRALETERVIRRKDLLKKLLRLF